MFRNSSTGSTRRIRSVHVVAAGALVLAMSGSATAAMVITGKQIKDNTITSKDIKNGSLRVKDFKSSEASKLRGPAGATGATGASGAAGAAGAAGASAFAPPPSGTVISGGGILNLQVNAAAVEFRSFSPLPFTAAVPFAHSGPSRNVHFGSTSFNADIIGSNIDATACAGTAAAPAPAAGKLCVYPTDVNNFGGMFVYAGSDSGSDLADKTGFYVYGQSDAAGNVLVRYVWAYKAA